MEWFTEKGKRQFSFGVDRTPVDLLRRMIVMNTMNTTIQRVEQREIEGWGTLFSKHV